MGLGALLFSTPHFSASSYSSGDSEEVSLCNVTRRTCGLAEAESHNWENGYKYVFMASQFLHGAGAAPLYTLGVTYIDENIGAASSAFFLGCFAPLLPSTSSSSVGSSLFLLPPLHNLSNIFKVDMGHKRNKTHRSHM